jgi:uncharacterized protein
MTVRLRTCVLLVMAELAWACTFIAAPTPASAQFFDNFPFFGGSRGRRSMQLPFFNQPRARPRAQSRPVQQGGQPGDYAHAPTQAPAKPEGEVPPEQKTIVVMGDSMADWLAYGLDQTYADTPDMAIVRKHRSFSSLIYNSGRHDPRNSVDWPVAAREMLANQPANFIVMMIGLSDRDPIRVAAVPPRPAPQPGAKPGQPAPTPQAGAKPGQPAPTPQAGAKPGQPAPNKPGQPDAGQQADQTKPAETPDSADPAAADPGTPAATYEFKTDKWAELYGKRIDETIAALKSKGVPVFWVGLPPILGTRSTADMQYLNELFRSHAEKAGITYIDIWDGFADDAGRFTMQGPDYEGQIRRLRSPDGVYFTPAGARKLAHYVEREIQRALTPTGPIAVPLPSEPLPDTPVASQQPGGGAPRPLAGPVVPLNASVDSSKSDQLLGGGAPQQGITDAVATRVLVKGDTMPAPAGRADDFSWPRRAPAPVGSDPVVATTTMPMTPMVASSGATQQPDANAAQNAAAAAAARAKAQQQAAAAHARQRVQPQYSYRQQQSPFFFFFGR